MSIFGNLEIGKTGLMASQFGQTVTGHNIANANTEGFSRQRLDQSADVNRYAGLNGVRVDGISRFYDQFSAGKVIGEQSQLSDWKSREAYMKSVETIFQDLDGKNLNAALDNFWNAFSSAATRPESSAERQNVIAAAQDLISQFQRMDQQLDEMQTSLNKELVDQMNEVNQLGQKIADLNQKIQNAGEGANADLKDKRDVALQQLASKMDIHWFFSKEGHLDINMPHGAALVRGTSAYEVKPYLEPLNPEFTHIGYEIAPSVLLNLSPYLKSGSLKATQTVRDDVLGSLRKDLQNLAKTLVDKTNELHASGHGMTPAYHEIISSYSLKPQEINVPLTHLKDGTLQIQIQPDKKNAPPLLISVPIQGGQDSLASIAENINFAAAKTLKNNASREKSTEEPPISAELTPDGKIYFKAGVGYSFTFAADDSQFLSRMGVHSLIEMQEDIQNMHLNPMVEGDEMQLALGKGENPGDNRIALAMHDLQFEKLMQNGSVTFNEFYRSIVNDVGTTTKKAIENSESHQGILDQYEALKKQVTGVNIDEEMTNMIKYQRAYEASAKYISTIDKMTETLINL